MLKRHRHLSLLSLGGRWICVKPRIATVFIRDILMMKRTLATIILVSSFSLSSAVMAASLADDMKTLGKNYKVFNQAKNPQDATAALNNMRGAAVNSKQFKLAAHTSEKVPSSTDLFEQIIVEIDKAKALVQAGKLDEAKQQGKKIAMLRDQGHKYYSH